MGSEPLQRKGCFGLGGIAGEALANEAKGECRHLLAALEHLGDEPMRGECRNEFPIDPAGSAAVGDRRKDVSGEGLRPSKQVAMGGGQVRVGRAHGITATPTSSTSASGSNSPDTPSTAIAG